ncbi:hypothetical protein SAMN05660909_05145 [Chitinophaga terrae (ex Kim and Jung 2007)]|uniref:Uncharacterized protein n=1 Tax=Chitinophaga terrae (ex Kim and Jung 2007) TaxID=408074 RepID=A0A1H4GBI4_9BACT|nr:hypothetical protein SAMN05660909_05145 [Chitinophaga terrae (ex Kim and Jung 2007)]
MKTLSVMNIKLCSSRLGELSRFPIPADSTEPMIMPSAEKCFYSDAVDNFKFIFQELSGDMYKVLFCFCISDERDTFTGRTDKQLQYQLYFVTPLDIA